MIPSPGLVGDVVTIPGTDYLTCPGYKDGVVVDFVLGRGVSGWV